MMSLIRRDPFENATISRLFGQLAHEPFLSGELDEGTLPLDISEDEKNVIVRASVPGFKPSDIDVEVHAGILTIKATHTDEKEEKTERFFRRVALPSTVEDNKTNAELKDGVLTLSIPKSEKALPRKVQIK